MATAPIDSKQQWRAWTDANVAKPFRKRALKAAIKSLDAGGTPDQAIAAAREAERKRANYMATSALVLGIISTVIALVVGGLSILATLFAIASAVLGAPLGGARVAGLDGPRPGDRRGPDLHWGVAGSPLLGFLRGDVGPPTTASMP